MSQHLDIRYLTGITDKNITFFENWIREEFRNGLRCTIISAKLTYQPSHCDCCGVLFDSHIIKHGFLKTNIQLNKSSNGLKTILEHRKQRYICRHCQSTL